MSKRITRIEWVTENDEFPDPSYLEQEGFEERLDAYHRGDFEYLHLYAFADIELQPTAYMEQQGVAITMHVQTPGLYGIESDSDADHLKEVATEELETLSAMLMELGFGRRQIEDAIARRA